MDVHRTAKSSRTLIAEHIFFYIFDFCPTRNTVFAFYVLQIFPNHFLQNNKIYNNIMILFIFQKCRIILIKNTSSNECYYV